MPTALRLLFLVALALPAQAQIPGTPDGGEAFGHTVAFGDFDGDGADDLAISHPNEDVGSAPNAGTVTVVYGSATSQAAFVQQWTRDSPDVDGDPRGGDQFGDALTTGDFDGDGYADLAIGIPGAQVSGRSIAGAVTVLYGSASGLTAAGSQLWHQDVADVEGVAEISDRFGRALATGDFDRDGYDELVIGIPNEDIGSTNDAGWVQVLKGASSGLTTEGQQSFHAADDGVPGALEEGDFFGGALAVGDFNGDTTDDLAIGVPLEDIGSIQNAGGLVILYGQVSTGLVTDGAQGWSQEDLVGGPEEDDLFGWALAAGNLDGDAFDDLLVGSPFEDTVDGDGNDYESGGIFHVIYGAPNGLAADRNADYGWFQDDADFGYALAIGNPGAEAAFVAVGVPGFDVGSETAAGMARVLYTTSDGIALDDRRQSWFQSLAGVEGTSEADDGLGWALATGDFNGDGLDDLAVGAPGEAIGSVNDAGYVNVLFAEPNGQLGVAGNLGLFEGGPLTTPSEPGVPEATTALAPPAPNPMAGPTTLRYRLAAPGAVRLTVYDLLGREVAVLVDGSFEAGRHDATFDAAGLPSGTYLVRMTTDEGFAETQRVTVLR